MKFCASSTKRAVSIFEAFRTDTAEQTAANMSSPVFGIVLRPRFFEVFVHVIAWLWEIASATITACSIYQYMQAIHAANGCEKAPQKFFSA